MSQLNLTVAAPHELEGIDPGVIAQIATLAAQEAVFIAAKNWAAAITTGLQIAGLVASLFAKTPDPVPVPGK